MGAEDQEQRTTESKAVASGIKASSAGPQDVANVRAGIAVICTALFVWFQWPVDGGLLPEARRMLGVTILMAGLWGSQVVPLAATSLLPIVLFPLLGIMAPKDVASRYINDIVFLYLGGFILAAGVERSGLHRRVALGIISAVGIRPRRLVLGFMIATGGLSIWISNTACSLMMLPIALALLRTLEDSEEHLLHHRRLQADVGGSGQSGSPRPLLLSRQLTVPLLLGIAYSASLGGMASIVGTPTNAQAVGILKEQLPEFPEPTMAQWLMMGIPVSILMMAAAWGILTFGLKTESGHDEDLRDEIRTHRQRLGRWSRYEFRMAIVFTAVAFLWAFRRGIAFGDSFTIPGWSEWLPSWLSWLGMSIHAPKGEALRAFASDATVAIGAAVLLFLLPSGKRTPDGERDRMMNWETARDLPWDIVLLFGGGFALAGGFESTGLAEWIGQTLQGPLDQTSPWIVVAVVCFLMTFLTEFTSNVATVSTLLPILITMTGGLDISPAALIFPAVLSTSCAFMLPIATPPNAIIFGSGRISFGQMMARGFLLNLLGIVILSFSAWTIIPLVFQQ